MLDMRRWVCLACARAREGELPPRWCSCGVEGASVRADGAAARALAGELPDDPDDGPEAHGGARAVLAGELDRPAPGDRIDTGSLELDRALGGGWPRSCAVAVWGEPGAGKSRLAARWAARAGPWLLVATEAPAADAVELARHAGADVSACYVLTELEAWISEARRLGVRAVVLDSISASARPARAARDAARAAHELGALVFVLAHRTRRGRAAGGAAVEHWPDATVTVAPRGRDAAGVSVRKSRFCPRTGRAIRVGLTNDSGPEI